MGNQVAREEDMEADLVNVFMFPGEMKIIHRFEIEHAIERKGEDIVLDRLLGITKPRKDNKLFHFGCFLEKHDSMLDRFDFEIVRDRVAALTASILDKRIGQVKPQLVSSKVSEEDFFHNYFTHVACVRRWLFGIDDIHFSLSNQQFVAKTRFLAGSNFSSVEDISKRLLQASPCRDSRVEYEWTPARRKLVMDLLKFSSPTLLSRVLEQSNQENRTIDWKTIYGEVVSLSKGLGSFLSHEALVDMDMCDFRFSQKRDLAAVEAAWDLDPRVGVAFRQLIPKYSSKQSFWENYFKNVSYIVEQSINQENGSS
mmetsp:Transcript_4982/g.7553  ORF Transcript_4982/g.7553 Transcript_4982/m.7553 type:complete len:312 (-) Transcript_4982:304-1239(-)